jgi:hypothetical protein
MLGYKEIALFAGTEDQLQQLIDWKAGSIAVLRRYGKTPLTQKERDMQRQFTIELRVDYADSDKNEEIRETLRQCARRALATANLIADNQKATRVAIWSDDFFSGHEEIALLDDVLGEVTAETINDVGDAPSNELLGAFRETR